MIKQEKIAIKDVQVAQDGTIVILTAPHTLNPKGAWKMNDSQTARVCLRAGVPSAFGLKHIAGITNGTSMLTFQTEDCKAGDTWKNERTGETGVYEKDWIKISNHEVALGFAGKMKLAELSLAQAFAQPQFAPSAPRVAVVAETDNTVALADPATTEAPIV